MGKIIDTIKSSRTIGLFITGAFVITITSATIIHDPFHVVFEKLGIYVFKYLKKKYNIREKQTRLKSDTKRRT